MNIDMFLSVLILNTESLMKMARIKIHSSLCDFFYERNYDTLSVFQYITCTIAAHNPSPHPKKAMI